jgi:RNA polymerase sigma-70 factor (ECF subfamily)
MLEPINVGRIFKVAKQREKTIAKHSGDLARRLNLGDNAAWGEFHAIYGPLVSRIVGKYASGDHRDAEDMAGEVFERLITALKSYDPSRSMEGYIVEIARRVRIDHYRRRLAQKRSASDGAMNISLDQGGEQGRISLRADDTDQETEFIRQERLSFLKEALMKISKMCRELLFMRYDQGLSYGEISDHLSVKETTLRVRAQRCLASLGTAYSELSQEDP